MPDIVVSLVGLAFLILWVYCIYDVITTDSALMQHLPKALWIIIVVLLGDLGSLLWLGLGRPRVWHRRGHEARTSGAAYGSRTPIPTGPELLSDPSLDRMDPIVRYREEASRLRMWEAQLKRREEALRHHHAEEHPSPPPDALPPVT